MENSFWSFCQDLELGIILGSENKYKQNRIFQKKMKFLMCHFDSWKSNENVVEDWWWVGIEISWNLRGFQVIYVKSQDMVEICEEERPKLENSWNY